MKNLVSQIYYIEFESLEWFVLNVSKLFPLFVLYKLATSINFICVIVTIRLTSVWHLHSGLLFLIVFRNRQQDHRQFFFVDLTVLIVVHAPKDRLLEVPQILSVVILTTKLISLYVLRKGSKLTFFTSSSRSFRNPLSSSFSIVPLLS